MTDPSDQPTEPELPQVEVDTTSSQRRVQLETENLIATYEQVAEWIRFADAKAAVVITVSGAMAGFVIPTLSAYLKDRKAVESIGDDPAKALAIGLFALFLVSVLISCVYAFRCILPFRFKGQHPSLGRCTHFHPAAIAAHYQLQDVDRFVGDYSTQGVAGFQQEVLAGLLIDSHISSHKYKHVTMAIRMIAGSAALAFLYLLSLQL